MYNYQNERPKIFTEDNIDNLLKVRDNARALLKTAGAAKMGNLMSGVSGDSWVTMAMVDYLVEKGDLKEITKNDCAGQDRVFIDPKNSFY